MKRASSDPWAAIARWYSASCVAGGSAKFTKQARCGSQQASAAAARFLTAVERPRAGYWHWRLQATVHRWLNLLETSYLLGRASTDCRKQHPTLI
jgi:hypothetical protein